MKVGVNVEVKVGVNVPPNERPGVMVYVAGGTNVENLKLETGMRGVRLGMGVGVLQGVQVGTLEKWVGVSQFVGEMTK